ncbi:MAG: DsbA family protein [Pseudomonadota bacterium]
MSTGEAGPARRSRRSLLAFAGIAAVGVAAWLGLQRALAPSPAAFRFEPLAEPKGFRSLAGGNVTVGPSPLFGLGGGNGEAVSPEVLAWARARPCDALFGTSTIPDGVVPIAVFTDFLCPYCRVQTQSLAELEERSAGTLRVVWHEWPILGDASVDAAKAALAAKRQGAYVAFHATLMGSAFLPTPAQLQRVALDVGIDPATMLADLDGPAVAGELERTEAVADLFRFVGTPAMVVGRTVVQGAIDDRELRALIERERQDGPIPACS